MIDVEKLVREGKTLGEIEKFLKDQVSACEKKIEKEKEEERSRKVKEELIEKARENAEKAIQEYYDLLDNKSLNIVVDNDKVKVNNKSFARCKKETNNENINYIKYPLSYILSDFFD